MEQQSIFALDIGTRSVVGIIAEEIDDQLAIRASVVEEHVNRSMVDGQIHDIEAVAKVVVRIKEKLETTIGRPIQEVAVAAAGRALKTVTCSMDLDVINLVEINREEVLGLELEAVQKAQSKLLSFEDEDNSRYHCVGYSVIGYRLDDMEIGNLVGQHGKTIAVDIVATFLPRIVVDSLFAVLKRAGLEMNSLTLEPIAASQVVIPQNMRMLNIALVDIGAGTSDIAITSKGSIVGYAMVPLAGDEITEELSHQYVVDFDTAERMKKEMLCKEYIEFMDILGFTYKLHKNEIIDKIKPQIIELASGISKKIIEINGKAPQAVICVGGGSLTPSLTDLIAEKLGIAPQRVAVRGREIVSLVAGDVGITGPDAITPLGIAYTAYAHKGLSLANVYVNGKSIRFFEINQGTVGDAILAAGIDLKRLHGRPGMALTVRVNNQIKIIRGSFGEAAIIKLNDNIAHLDSKVVSGDKIEFMEAQDGENAKGSLKDVIPEFKVLNLVINSLKKKVYPIITIDHLPASLEDDLLDGVEVHFREVKTLQDALESLEWSDFPENWVLRKNGMLANLANPIADGDEIIIEEEKNVISLVDLDDTSLVTNQTNEDRLDQGGEKAEIILEEKTKDIEALEVTKIYVDNNNKDIDDKDIDDVGDTGYRLNTTVYVNGDKIVIYDRADIIFADIFPHVSGFEAKPPEVGAILVMQVNGIPAEFVTPIKSNDRIQLYWKI
jgi:cell division protein FtsA